MLSSKILSKEILNSKEAFRMKELKSFIAIVALAFTVFFAGYSQSHAEVAEYMIDPDHSQATFKVKHLAISTSITESQW